jgi:hypothetical protein
MIQESLAFRESALLGRLAFLHDGPDPAELHVFGGARPADVASAAGSPPLGVVLLAEPAGVVSGGTLALTQAADGMVTTTGTATWCRLFNGAGVACFDMDAGGPGSGAEAVFPDTLLLAGGGLRLLSCVLG